MNQRVTVAGMEVKTKVSSNLLINTENTEATFATAITQEQQEILEPVSTINGVNFFYTLDAKADGSKNNPTTGEGAVEYTTYNISTAASNTSNYANKFSEDYSLTKTAADALIDGKEGAVGYVDYTFYIKATNAEESAQAVKMTRCNLKYNNAVLSGDSEAGKAWRVGLFAQEVAKGAAGSGDGTLKTVLGLSGASYFTATNQAVASTSTKSSVSLFGTAANIDTALASGATKYYKVVVRLWLEGEDTSCNNDTFAKLTSSWKLDLAFEMGTGTPDPVTVIGSAA